VASGFDLPSLDGLSQEAARARLASDGPNELPSRSNASFLRTALGVVREPMILLLIATGVLYLVLGDHEEAILLLGSIVLIVVIELYQERRTERTLAALRDLSSPRALVIRDGQRQRIASREVVVDDVVLLAEGDRVPADCVLLSCTNLSTDESLLTGESVPVRKRAREPGPGEHRPGGDDLPYVYSGSLVTTGQGVGRVVATGPHTEMGQIGQALQTLPSDRTRLQDETDRVVRILAVLGLALCVTVVVGYTLSRGDLVQGILAGLTLAMALVPEEFPVVLTVFLALGAWRIAQQQVLTRRSPAIEALGTTTVMCVDKTGTLTQNRMTVRCLAARGHMFQVGGGQQHPCEFFSQVVDYAILASPLDPFDPMERAIKDAGSRLGSLAPEPNQLTLVRAYPLSDRLLAMVHVWQTPGSSTTKVVAAKGAPEAIAELCHFDSARAEQLHNEVATMAAAGLRILGVARAYTDGMTLPDDPHVFPFDFLGLIGLADPIRPAIPAAISECYRAGIRVVMLTGDYSATARSIAQQIGLRPLDPVLTGSEIENLSDTALQAAARRTSIFARVRPEQKLRLVRTLRANGEVVAMTGDGVNDAPALKAANIGIAMGGRGTDVAREAAALVLLDDDFASIVHAVRLGRRIFDNLRKAMAFLLAVHVPIAGLALLPLLLGWPLILLPAHIVFLELIIDPACSLVFEAEHAEGDVMHRPPRPAREPLFSGSIVRLSLLQGASVLLAVLIVLAVAMTAGRTEGEARALAFTTLVLADLALILSNRSISRAGLADLRSRNLPLWAVSFGALLVLSLVLSIGSLRALFGFGVVRAEDLLMALLASVVTWLWMDAWKLLTYRRQVAAPI
jgi:P-type Ca2+ transporter type 2C